MALEPVKRAAYLENLGATDPGMREELESLLAQESATGFLKTSSAFSLSEESVGHDPMIGRRLGPYEIVEQIGAGGMGEVYRAVRADDQYKKQVAIKLVHAGQRSAQILTRFRNERQILANLDHPNIARLLDGGMAPQTTPYLVMDLIDGHPIDEYCDNHHLTITSRLKIFLEVCSAVSYAHRRLIVHRDLKPGNILVTEEGVPKLLDFGIAKILESGDLAGLEVTATVLRVLTPGYASPEQINGETITTLSDVYSLGVVLYELLTGHHPYRVPSRTPEAISRAVREFEPERPSAVVLRTEATMEHHDRTLTPVTVSAVREGSPEKLRKRLSGDLDNIVLLAMRNEPERRYASVEKLADDVRRHLEDLPVLARKDSWNYRAKKFGRRNRAGVAAGALAVLTALVGVAAVIQQNTVARAERARADRRFNDVRKLAHSLLFQDHDAIATLPGSTSARKLIISQSLEYLDSLAKEASGDLPLQQELAAAYQRVGELQGLPWAPNLGDAPGAVASLTKAVGILEPIARQRSTDIDSQVLLAKVYREIGMIRLVYLGNVSMALDDSRRALAVVEKLNVGPPDRRVVNELSADNEQLGQVLGGGNGTWAAAGDTGAALKFMARSVQLSEQLIAIVPDDRSAQFGLVTAQLNYADALIQLSRRQEARLSFEATAQFVDRLRVTRPDDVMLRRTRGILSGRIAEVLAMDGHYEEALRNFRAELAEVEPLVAADAKNHEVRVPLVGAYLGIGHVLADLDRIDEALEVFRRARAVLTEDITFNQTAEAQVELALVHIFTGDALRRRSDLRGALRGYEQSRGICEALIKLAPNNATIQLTLAGTLNEIAGALLALNDTVTARQEFERALQINQSVAAHIPSNLEAKYSMAETNAGLGDVAATTARQLPAASAHTHWASAAGYYRASLQALDSIKNPAVISPGLFRIRSRDDTVRRLEASTAAAQVPNPTASN